MSLAAEGRPGDRGKEGQDLVRMYHRDGDFGGRVGVDTGVFEQRAPKSCNDDVQVRSALL